MIAVCLVLSGCAGGSHLSFLDPQGPVAALQRRHFIEVLALLAVFVALPIFLLIPWIVMRYRYGAPSPGYTPRWGKANWLEVAMWSGPAVIVIALGTLVWRSTKVLDPYRPLPSAEAPLRLQVIGYDWNWLFIYPDEGVASIGIAPLPAGRAVSIELTSATVMQSLFIPALGSQIYAMGGMVSQLHLRADRPGRFLGENTMYNGDGFHQERFTAVAMTPQAFDAWVGRARRDAPPLDDDALAAITRQSTFTQLRARLPRQAGAADPAALTFNHASPDLFAHVVMATMSAGTAMPPSALLATPAAAPAPPAPRPVSGAAPAMGPRP